MDIIYKNNVTPSVDKIIELYKSSGLPRPVNNKERIKKMYDNSNLVVTAWDGDLLVGISRSLTDFCWSCYLADLAVMHEYQGKGIGKKLVDLTKDEIGEQTMLLLLSVPTAMEYYPKIGLNKVENGFIIDRTK
ncbi:MAG TPA: GNAT family N-acetyltransferase [Ignavibacteriaceae bacterium]|nr:GNAT family N-acetyltransferase [Ignavibacteriaceae bacterium]